MLKPIDAPGKQSWDSAVEAVHDALELEKTVNQVMECSSKNAGIWTMG